MRDFPLQVGPGGEPVSDSSSWTSSNANDTFQETQNTITDTGQTLIGLASPPDNSQLSQAISRNAAAATFYADSGTANVYVLSALGSFKSPTVYLDGQIVRWIAINANTGASTINVSGVGVKSLTAEGGAAVSSGDIDTVTENQARFNMADDRFELVRSAAIVGPSSGSFKSVQVFTASGTWTKPAGINFVTARVLGGGGGGGGGDVGQNGSDGGAAGGYCEEFIDVSGTSSETITIGGGAAGGPAGNNNGSDGGTSSFGSFCSATGGSGGFSTTNSSMNTTPRGSPGVGVGGDFNIFGGEGVHASTLGGTNGGNGGSSYFGGGPTGHDANGVVGRNAQCLGCGGGGTFQNATNAAGGNGAPGIIIVEEYS